MGKVIAFIPTYTKHRSLWNVPHSDNRVWVWVWVCVYWNWTLVFTYLKIAKLRDHSINTPRRSSLRLSFMKCCPPNTTTTYTAPNKNDFFLKETKQNTRKQIYSGPPNKNKYRWSSYSINDGSYQLSCIHSIANLSSKCRSKSYSARGSWYSVSFILSHLQKIVI